MYTAGRVQIHKFLYTRPAVSVIPNMSIYTAWCNCATKINNKCYLVQLLYYLRQGGYVFARLCFVCLSVCVSAR